MNTYDFVHLSLLALGGKVGGRTNLQKKVYFLGIMTGCLEDLGYRAHYYGPYSDQVSAAVGQLEELAFVDTASMTWGVDNHGFEMTKTDFCLTEDGKTVAENKAQQNSDLWKKMQDAARILNSVPSNYVRLSIAAKTYFMLSRGEVGSVNATEDRLAELSREFGWSVTVEQIREATALLRTFGLEPSAA